MSAYTQALKQLVTSPRTWLVTGVAGFIGSHLLESLLLADQRVVGVDNFSTGKRKNLSEVLNSLSARRQERFQFIAGDLCEPAVCREACQAVDYVLHQAALGSVPRSLENPLASNAANVTGFLNMLVAAREEGVRRFVYASSSSVYGDEPSLPKVESRAGEPLSPYAVTKVVNELYARVFARAYGLETIGLRYFNVFGPRQDPEGPYAAVIPRWIGAMLSNRQARLHGDGSTSRDFCYVANAVQANILAATTSEPGAVNQVYNIALNARTSLNELFEMIRGRLLEEYPRLHDYQPLCEAFRPGDIRASQADISKAQRLLHYAPTHTLADGLDLTLAWHRAHRAAPVPRTAAVQEAVPAAPACAGGAAQSQGASAAHVTM